jgi:hypothetical protein
MVRFDAAIFPKSSAHNIHVSCGLRGSSASFEAKRADSHGNTVSCTSEHIGWDRTIGCPWALSRTDEIVALDLITSGRASPWQMTPSGRCCSGVARREENQRADFYTLSGLRLRRHRREVKRTVCGEPCAAILN